MKPVALTFPDVIKLYDAGFFTLEGVYEYCDTDLDMYKFLQNHCGYQDQEVIKEKMIEVSEVADAYYNALDYLSPEDENISDDDFAFDVPDDETE